MGVELVEFHTINTPEYMQIQISKVSMLHVVEFSGV